MKTLSDFDTAFEELIEAASNTLSSENFWGFMDDVVSIVDDYKEDGDT